MNDDPIVYINTSGVGGNGRTVYHTDEDCRSIEKMRKVSEKRLSLLPDHLRECKMCAGTNSKNKTTQPFAMRDKLLATDADAVGDSA